jgi:hypothetical protein
MLSDGEWAQIASDVMHRTGLAPHGQEDDAVRWVAVRHGDDHIHIVAMLARQDGRRPRWSNDRYRVRQACQAAEERYGLRRTAPGDRTAAACPSRAESEKAARRGLDEAPRVTLRRDVSRAAAAASGEREFFALLRKSGVLVRTRESTRHPGEVTGYSVAVPGDSARGGGPVWFGGGKLAPDLTLPRLRRCWQGAEPLPGGAMTAAERAVAWDQALDAVGAAAAHVREMAAGHPDGAADAAWAASATMHAAAGALESRVLRQAADAYDRAARVPYGRIPPPSRAGGSLRQAARLLSAVGAATGEPALRTAVLVLRLAALAEAVGGLRRSQERADQADAALAAARRLRASSGAAPAAASPVPGTAAGLGAAGFPFSPGPARRAPQTSPPPRRPSAPDSRPSRGPGR